MLIATVRLAKSQHSEEIHYVGKSSRTNTNKLANSRNNYRKLNFWGRKLEKQFGKHPK
jgi:hypothetical protein